MTSTLVKFHQMKRHLLDSNDFVNCLGLQEDTAEVQEILASVGGYKKNSRL